MSLLLAIKNKVVLARYYNISRLITLIIKQLDNNIWNSWELVEGSEGGRYSEVGHYRLISINKFHENISIFVKLIHNNFAVVVYFEFA